MRKRILVIGLLTLAALGIAQSQTYKYSTLYAFQENGKDPRNPNSLIIDLAGNLYGTSNRGGVFKEGTVFEFTPAGLLTVLHNFDSSALNPTNVVRDTHGNLYGATLYEARVSASEVFKLAPQNGTYDFSVLSVTSDEYAEVALDSAGDVFGLFCGQNTGGPDCSSTSLFEIPAGGKYATLSNLLPFDSYPSGNLVIDKSGNIYGTGTGNGFETDLGYVFGWSPVSGLSVLHTFNGTDGSYPLALTQDAAGNLYGVTNGGGANNAGTVFKISPSTGFSTLYNFCSLPNCADGNYPGSLLLDPKGNIYGATISGVFKLAQDGAESLIYSSIFTGYGLAMDKAGNLYGLQTRNSGSIYKLTRTK